MGLTKWIIANKIVALTVFIMLGVGGAISYFDLPQSEDPGFEIKTASIATFYPGASPEKVEELVTEKIENIINEMSGIDFIESESKNGLSVIFLNIDEKYRGMRPYWDLLRRKMEKVKYELPKGTIGPMVNDEFGDVFGTLITVEGKDFTQEEFKNYTDDIRDELLKVKGVAKVEVNGVQERQIFIEFNHTKLASLGIPPIYIKQLLANRNIIVPSGSVLVNGQERMFLESSGDFENVDEIRNTIVRLPNSNSVFYLKDLVSVKETYIDPAKEYIKVDGKLAVIIAVSMVDGGNIITLGKNLRKKVDELEHNYPYGLNINFLYEQSVAVSTAVNGFMSNLFQSILIVIFVMLLALGFRTGLMISAVIPLVILATFLGMSLLGLGVDKISLAALLIALGMLVDNSIVTSEAILVKVQNGMDVVEASLTTTKELYRPLLISSLITSAAFLPILLAKSGMGEYVGPLAKVITLTLLISWSLSMTMIPLMNIIFLKVKQKNKESKEEYTSIVYRTYKKILLLFLRNKIISVTLIIALFYSSLVVFGKIKQQFFPESDNPTINVEIQMPLGTSIERSMEITNKYDEFIRKNLMVNDKRKEGITSWSDFVGRSAPRYILNLAPKAPSPDYTAIVLRTTNIKTFEEIRNKSLKFFGDNYPEAIVILRKIANGKPIDYPVEVILKSNNLKELEEFSIHFKDNLRKAKGVNFVIDDWKNKVKKIVVKVNSVKAYHAGVTNFDVAISLLTSLDGYQISNYRDGKTDVPIILRGDNIDRNSVENLENLSIYSSTSQSNISLKQVADIKIEFEYPIIRRRDKLKTMKIQAVLKDGYFANDINKLIVPWLDKNKTSGISYELGGEDFESKKATASVFEIMPLAGLIILFLLVLQFNSFKKPLVLILTVPLGLIGISYGLFLTGQTFGFMPLLGVIALSGIIINNSNVLLDQISNNADSGMSMQDAVIKGGMSRLRPIFLTSATTVGGLIPLWIAQDPMWVSMAVALIFGLSFATLLTTTVVPLLFSIIFNISYKNYNA